MSHEPESKPVEYNDNALDSIGLKSGNGFVKEIESGKLSYLKGMEVDADRLTNIAPVPSHSSPKMEPFKESVLYMDKSVMEREVPELIVCYKENTYHVKDICVDEGVPLQDKFLFDTDAHEKNESERDMNNEMVKEKSDLGMLIPDMMKSSSQKKNVDLYLPVPGVLVSSEKKGLKYDLFLDCNSKHLMRTEEVDYVTKNVTNDASKEILSLRDLFSMSELGTRFTPSNASNHSMDKIEEQSLLCPRENAVLETDSAGEESANCGEKISVSSALVSAAEELDNGCEAATLAIPTQDPAYQEADHGNKEAILVSPTHISAAEESDSKEKELASHALDSISEEVTRRVVDERPYDSKAETQSISSDNVSSTPTGSPTHISAAEEPDSKETKLASHALDSISEEVTRRIVDELPYDSKTETQSISLDNVSPAPTGSAREPPQNNGAQILSRFEDPNAESLSGGQLQYADGESSFSSSGPLFGLISHSGPVAYSGSVSLRSDSSTTSTRSFAFPILQSEWNSSPVRMAKADRRHFQKPRKWMQGLLCCGF
ncbi:hypothetical protein SADUNF_Sadunf08G0090200 [Salix dunnii]|uniref:18S pre-ribosomal assembly protein gar2-like protein n=1 Tax=Salix dunnii TaxID=1413687 RepID=A0A835JTQ6_9ROSI|nr:hypothetical protein SADUNF_Sadunf08G0090200 [Salix dunnii]